MTLRNYQDPSKIFFSAKVFKEVFPGKAPDFDGSAPKPAPSPASAPSPSPAPSTSPAKVP
jgi:hypothetical protein